MGTWEYRLLQVGGDQSIAASDVVPWSGFQELAAQWGSDGWELVGMSTSPEGNTMAVFKRPVGGGRRRMTATRQR